MAYYEFNANDESKALSKALSNSSEKPLCLLDLPNELLLETVSGVNVWHYDRIRRSSVRLRDIVDTVLWDKYSELLKTVFITETNLRKKIVIEIFHQSVDIFIRGGYFSTFSGTILHHWRAHQSNTYLPLNIKEYNVDKILKKYYIHIFHLDNPYDNYMSAIYFSLTWINQVKLFKNKKIINNIISDDYWYCSIEVDGIFIGKSKNDKDKPSFVAIGVIIAILLIAVNAGFNTKKIFECQEVLYVYGHSMAPTKARLPKIIFAFKVRGSHNICRYFSYFFSRDDDVLKTIPNELPKDPYKFSLELSCIDSCKWGFKQNMNVIFEHNSAS